MAAAVVALVVIDLKTVHLVELSALAVLEIEAEKPAAAETATAKLPFPAISENVAHLWDEHFVRQGSQQ